MGRFAFQQATIDAIEAHYKEHDRALCADEAGMGKTFIAKGVIEQMAEQHVLDQIRQSGRNTKQDLQDWWAAFCEVNANEGCFKIGSGGGLDANRQRVMEHFIRDVSGVQDWAYISGEKNRVDRLKNAFDLSKADDAACLRFLRGIGELLHMRNKQGLHPDWNFESPKDKKLTDIIQPFYALYICCNLDIAAQNTEKLTDIYQPHLKGKDVVCDRLSVLWKAMEAPSPYITLYSITSTVSTRQTAGTDQEFKLLKELVDKLDDDKKPEDCKSCKNKDCKGSCAPDKRINLRSCGEEVSLKQLKDKLNLIIFDEFQNFGDIITMLSKPAHDQTVLINNLEAKIKNESVEEKKKTLQSRLESAKRIRTLVFELYGSLSKKPMFKTLFLSATPFHDPSETDEDAFSRIGFDDLLGALGVSQDDITRFKKLKDPKEQEEFLYSTAGIFRSERRQLLGAFKERKIDERQILCPCTGVLSQAVLFQSGGQGDPTFRAILSTPEVLKWRDGYAINKKVGLDNLEDVELAEHGRFQMLQKIVCAPSADWADDSAPIPEELLWIPPSKPSRSLEGVFATYKDYSKSLVFSSLAMTPKALCTKLNAAKRDKAVLDDNDRNTVKEKYLDNLLRKTVRDSSLAGEFLDMLLKNGAAAFGRNPTPDDFINYCENGCLEDVLREFCALYGSKAPEMLKDYLKKANGDFAWHMASPPEGDSVAPRKMQSVFNTPFRPFVAVSTSIGAEGLDFHFYCNRLIHYTLPPNAIKLEQMNGRIDRMNSHAVRRWWSDPERYWDAFLREDLVNQSGGLSPYWDYGNKELHYYYLYMMGTNEKDRLDALLSSREAFRKKLGTWQDDIDGAVNLCPFLKRTK